MAFFWKIWLTLIKCICCLVISDSEVRSKCTQLTNCNRSGLNWFSKNLGQYLCWFENASNIHVFLLSFQVCPGATKRLGDRILGTLKKCVGPFVGPKPFCSHCDEVWWQGFVKSHIWSNLETNMCLKLVHIHTFTWTNVLSFQSVCRVYNTV